MFKNLLFVFAISAFFVSCNQSETKEVANLTIDNFQSQAEKYVNQEITIEGTVNHVCKHSGKRMFIINDNPDVSIKIIPGNNIPGFDVELEGSEVFIKGLIVEDYKIDMEFLDEWEAEILAEEEEAIADEEIAEVSEGVEEAEEAIEETEVEVTEAVAEEKVAEEHNHSDVHLSKEEEGDGAGHGDHHLTGLEKVEKYRKQLSESGKAEIIIYMIKCTELTEKE